MQEPDHDPRPNANPPAEGVPPDEQYQLWRDKCRCETCGCHHDGILDEDGELVTDLPCPLCDTYLGSSRLVY